MSRVQLALRVSSLDTFMVAEICEWRRIRIATRGWTPRATSKDARVLRVAWTWTLRTPALSQAPAKLRRKFD